MLVLRTTTDFLELVLAAAPTTQPAIYASYRDIGTTTDSYVAAQNDLLANGTTAVTVVGSPASNVARLIDFINIFNQDSANVTVTLRYINSAAGQRPLFTVTLAPSERLEYTDAKGFAVYANNGSLKQTFATGNSPVSSLTQQLVLGTAVTNNNAVANTIQDVTGLQFAVNSGARVRFKFTLLYSAAATTTGARFSINGPTTSALAYRSDYNLTTTSRTVNDGLTAYDQPAAANASSAVTGPQNIAIVEGILTASAAGNVVARFASEVASSAIVVQPGSFVEWQVI